LKRALVNRNISTITQGLGAGISSRRRTPEGSRNRVKRTRGKAGAEGGSAPLQATAGQGKIGPGIKYIPIDFDDATDRGNAAHIKHRDACS
jgi:hypothetical protein